MRARICDSESDIVVINADLDLPKGFRTLARETKRRGDDVLVAVSVAFHIDSGWEITAVFERA